MRSRGPALAAVPGWAMLASVLLGVTLVGLLGRDPSRLMEAARWAAALLAMGLAGVLDDPSAELHASLPTPDRRVRLRAIAVAVPALGTAWLAITWLGDRPAFVGSETAAVLDGCLALARFGLGVEAAGVLTLTLAAAAIAARRGVGLGSGTAGAAATVLLYAGRPLVPRDWTLAASPVEALWRPTGLRWVVLAALGTAALLYLTGDRWRRPRLRRVVGLVAVGIVTAGLLAATTPPRGLERTFEAVVEDQQLVASEVSLSGPVTVELRRGPAPGGVAVLDVVTVTRTATLRSQVPVTGSLTADELLAWSATLPVVHDQEWLTRAITAAPPAGLRPRDDEEAAGGVAVAEVIVDQRGGQSIASVASRGRRTCGVSVAGNLYGALAG